MITIKLASNIYIKMIDKQKNSVYMQTHNTLLNADYIIIQ